jgi:hypothetical protein
MIKIVLTLLVLISANSYLFGQRTEKIEVPAGVVYNYWSVISFDIEEPLVIIETTQERYILNINPKTMKLIWLDQAP